ncbi:MAG: alkaline phosphatase family protein [Candidatus Nanoarchaeia archaeon]|nr:alkaline phosphatase family protein [Candidatus Nanoarchaeia archaeon]
MAEKLLFIILDGVGDEPVPSLGNKTPLEASEKPNMDFLARTGQTGSVTVIEEGIAPTSETATLALLGYDPFKYYTGRGPLAAYGADIGFEEGDVALRTNLGVIKNGRILDIRVGDLTTVDAKRLADSINRQVILSDSSVSFKYYPTMTYRGILLLKSKKEKLSEQVSNTHPAYIHIKGISASQEFKQTAFKQCVPKADTKSAELTAKLVNEFIMKSHEVLETHEVNTKRAKDKKQKANIILTREAGNRLPNLPSIEDKYSRLWLCIADLPMEAGVAKLAGMEVVNADEPNLANIQATLKDRTDTILKNWGNYDCFYVHIKGPDVPSHEKEPETKKKIIEAIDKHFIGALLSKINLSKTIICITSDHTTSSVKGIHTPAPVPLLISGAGVRMDTVKSFAENTCKEGLIGSIRGVDVMPLVMKKFVGE